MDTLKPCPICGGEAQLEDYRDGGGNGFAVHCQTFTCQTCGPIDLGVSGAIEQWNNRPLEERLLNELNTALNALRSYQYDNGSPDLAKLVADHIQATLATFKRVPL